MPHHGSGYDVFRIIAADEGVKRSGAPDDEPEDKREKPTRHEAPRPRGMDARVGVFVVAEKPSGSSGQI